MSLSKRSKIFISLILIGLVVAIGVYEYAMQPPESIESKKADFTGNASVFLSEIQNDFSVFEDKIVILDGTISQIGENSVIINDQVYCQFKDQVSTANFKEDQNIKIKCHVLGYDDLLEEVKLNECVIQK